MGIGDGHSRLDGEGNLDGPDGPSVEWSVVFRVRVHYYE